MSTTARNRCPNCAGAACRACGHCRDCAFNIRCRSCAANPDGDDIPACIDCPNC